MVEFQRFSLELLLDGSTKLVSVETPVTVSMNTAASAIRGFSRDTNVQAELQKLKPDCPVVVLTGLDIKLKREDIVGIKIPNECDIA